LKLSFHLIEIHFSFPQFSCKVYLNFQVPIPETAQTAIQKRDRDPTARDEELSREIDALLKVQFFFSIGLKSAFRIYFNSFPS
jgi:hypothetical protein